VGVTRIESNRNRHFGLKIESKSIENRNLEIVTSLPLRGKSPSWVFTVVTVLTVLFYVLFYTYSETITFVDFNF